MEVRRGVRRHGLAMKFWVHNVCNINITLRGVTYTMSLHSALRSTINSGATDMLYGPIC
jgi:hypothetical protein